MTTRNQHIRNFWSGDTLPIQINVVDADGNPADLTGATIRYAIADKVGGTIRVAKSTTDGTITIGAGDSTNDAVFLTLEPADTAELKGQPTKGYPHEMEIEDVSGNVSTAFTGKIYLETDTNQ